MPVYLRDDLRSALGLAEDPQAVFTALAAVDGKTYRRTASRRTFQFDAGGRGYFAKLHTGVGWREIVKNLATLKAPAVDAGREFRACRHLARCGVRAPTVAAFARIGLSPASRRSVLVCDALDGFVSLEQLLLRQESGAPGDGESVSVAAPPAGQNTSGARLLPGALRRRLLCAVAQLVRAMHAAGVNHRDCYIGHIYADAAKLAEGRVDLAVIDLHRAGLHRRVPRRWLVRDLAALWSSAAPAALTRHERLRFLRIYTGERPATALRRRPRLWKAIARRTERLVARGARDSAALPL